MEKIQITLYEDRNGVAEVSVYPELDLVVYNIGTKGGLFVRGKFESQAIPLSDLEVDLETLRELGEVEE